MTIRNVIRDSVSLDEAINLLLKRFKSNKISDLAGTWDVSDGETEKINESLKAGWKRICIDTDVLIDLLRGQETEKIKELEQEDAILMTTVINSFELYYGAYKTKKRSANLSAVRGLLKRLVILQMSEEASEVVGEILGDLESKGQMIDFRDALIAGIVVMNGATLFTRNINHFNRIDRVKIRN
ncbi:MAG: type II toxin-antitoxin system VapC family toxin [Methanotrichaceae archaeon]